MIFDPAKTLKCCTSKNDRNIVYNNITLTVVLSLLILQDK